MDKKRIEANEYLSQKEVSFENVRLAGINLKLSPASQIDSKNSKKLEVKKEGVTSFEVNDKSYKIYCFETETADVGGFQHWYKFSVFRKEDGLAEECLAGDIVFQLKQDADEVVATTAIIRKNDSKQQGGLPSGFGSRFYEKMLDFISGQVYLYKKPIRHKVGIMLGYSEQDISEDTWRKIFLPILEERGYQDSKSADANFEKIYK